MRTSDWRSVPSRPGPGGHAPPRTLIRGGPVNGDAFAAALADEFAAAEAVARQRVQGPAGQNLGARGAVPGACRRTQRVPRLQPLEPTTVRGQPTSRPVVTTLETAPAAPGRGPGKGHRQRQLRGRVPRRRPGATPGRCCPPSPPAGSPTSTPRRSRQMPGVLRVWWHGNAPLLADVGMPMLAVLQSAEVHFRGEVVALVAATSPGDRPGGGGAAAGDVRGTRPSTSCSTRTIPACGRRKRSTPGIPD